MSKIDSISKAVKGDKRKSEKTMKMMKKSTRAQTVIEYAILISVVAIAFVAMKTYVERSVNANIKLIEEQINAEPD